MTPARASRGRARVVAVIGILAVIALTAIRHSPPSIDSSSVAERPASGEFDGSRAVDSLRAFVADGTPRPVGSPGHTAARERLRALITRLGCEVEEQPFMARGWNRTAVPMMNLLVRVPGTSADSALPCVLLSAHYDSVAAGPGAGDNAGGVACALEIIRALHASPPERTVLVLFPDGEEVGLYGARVFASDHASWKEVGAVVNLDARGSDGPVYIFEVGADQAAHAGLLCELSLPARTTSLAAEAYRRMPNGTDFTVYLRGARPGFNLAFIGSPRNYHAASDTIENLSTGTLNQMGSSALALVRALASGAAPMLTASELGDGASKTSAPVIHPTVWFDVFGFLVVAWPAWCNALALGVCAFALLWSLRSMRRDSRATLIGSCLGAVDVVMGITLAISLGTLTTGLLIRSHLVELPWPIASIWWGNVLLLALGAAAALIPSRLVARHRVTRRTTSCAGWDAWFGGWFTLGALAILIAAAAPGAAHPFLIPVVAASILTFVAWKFRWTSPDWCAVGAGLVAVSVWAPLEQTFADAFGLSLGGFTALRGALLVLALRPLGDPIGHQRHEPVAVA